MDFADAISYPAGSVAACYKLPLQAQPELIFLRQKGACGRPCWMWGFSSAHREGNQGNASRFSHTAGKDDPCFRGLLLRYTPGLSAADLAFIHPLFRSNQAFDVPLYIPE